MFLCQRPKHLPLGPQQSRLVDVRKATTAPPKTQSPTIDGIEEDEDAYSLKRLGERAEIQTQTRRLRLQEESPSSTNQDQTPPRPQPLFKLIPVLIQVNFG